MENQHRKIKGYRDLSQEEIDLMNEIKEHAAKTGELVDRVKTITRQQAETGATANDKEAIGRAHEGGRWASIAKTDLQTGFMALTRAIAQPDFF